LTAAPRGERMADEARVVAGSLSVAGRDVGRGEHRAVSGRVALDAAMPADWSVGELLLWHGRLSGKPARNSREQAIHALELLGFGSWNKTKLRALGVIERRAISIAAALVCQPQVVIIERPLEGLGEDMIHWMLAVIAKATEGRGAILSTTSMAPGTASALLARGASDILLLHKGALAAQLTPDELFARTTRFEVTVERGADALCDALSRRGIALAGGPRHFSLTLPDGTTTADLFDAASEVRAAVVGCMPLSD
jgi:ABC-2 type transport system ATP-binding protein